MYVHGWIRMYVYVYVCTHVCACLCVCVCVCVCIVDIYACIDAKDCRYPPHTHTYTKLTPRMHACRCEGL